MFRTSQLTRGQLFFQKLHRYLILSFISIYHTYNIGMSLMQNTQPPISAHSSMFNFFSFCISRNKFHKNPILSQMQKMELPCYI